MDFHQKNVFGDNNVYKIGAIPRSLNPVFEHEFLAELDKLPKSTITIRAHFSEAESQALSREIYDVFKKAGWDIRGPIFELPRADIKNVALGVPKTEEKSLTALIIWNWLNANGLKANAELVSDEKGYIIFAGRNI
jgi:hypothetical protein